MLVAPQAYGETNYYTYIIVNKDSPVEKFEDLRGKSFAFTDPLSNTGKLVPTYLLALIKETPDSFFKKYIYTYAHDKSILAVANKFIDAAAVDNLIWEYQNRTNPKFTSRTRIINKSQPFGISPVVVRKNLDDVLKAKLKKVFLDAHKDETAKYYSKI